MIELCCEYLSEKEIQSKKNFNVSTMQNTRNWKKEKHFLKNLSLPVQPLPRLSHRGASKHPCLYLELNIYIYIYIVRNIKFKDEILGNIRVLFEADDDCYVPRVLFEIDDDCHVPIKTKRAFNKNYIQYESNNGKYKNL